MNENTNYLVHHGILGQKWGKQNGPPYPLGYDDHSVAERWYNPVGELDNYSNKQALKEKARSYATNNKKKLLLIGGIVITALVVREGREYINQKKEQPISEITDYWKQHSPYKSSFSTNRMLKGMNNDLMGMKYKDLLKEAHNIKKNDFSTLSFDSKKWH